MRYTLPDLLVCHFQMNVQKDDKVVEDKMSWLFYRSESK